MRRGPSVTIALALLLTTLASLPTAALQTSPNIVVVMLDDLDAGTVDRILDSKGGLSPKYFPNLAWLARRGVVARNAFANATSCCPSRATFLTGTFNSVHDVWSNGDGEYFEPDPFAPEPPIGGGFREFRRRGHEANTIAVALNDRYRTIGVGKYLNGYRTALLPTNPGRACPSGQSFVTPGGWNAWFGLTDGSEQTPLNGYGHYAANINGCAREVEDTDTSRMLTDAVRFSLSQIERAQQNNLPFFLYLATRNVHSVTRDGQQLVKEWIDPVRLRHFANARYYWRCGEDPTIDDPDDVYDGTPSDCSDLYSFNEARKPGGLDDKPAWVRSAQIAWRFGRVDPTFRRRLASLESFDASLGRLLNGLESRGVLDETFIAVTSDQGFKLYEHGLRFGKNTPYDPDIRIPLIVAGPGIESGKNFWPIVSMVDLHATLREAAGVTPAGSGVSFLSALQGGPPPDRNYVFVEGIRGIALDPPRIGKPMVKFQVIRTTETKFIWTRAISEDGEDVAGSDEYEVYDLRLDKHELNARPPSAEERLRFSWAIARCASGTCPPNLDG
jgi:N-acetylglucosamine-6-sulfatase